MIDKIIPLWIRERSHQSIWLIMSLLIIGCWSLPVPDNLISLITEQSRAPTMVRIFLTLLFLVVGFSISLIILYRKLHSKPKLKNYRYMEDPGIYVNKKTGDRYCGKCFDGGELSRLSFHAEYGLICRRCGEPYVSPFDYVSTWKQATQDDKNS